MRRVVFIVVLITFCRCSSDARLEAHPNEIKADGTSSAQIVFYEDRKDGPLVSFETDRGYFLEEGGVQTTYVTRSLAGGRASIDLHAGIEPGLATVTATSDYGSASVKVTFLPLKPSGRFLSLRCDSLNIGALRNPLPDIAAHCHLELQERDGSPIDPRGLRDDDFGFVAEAGAVNPVEQVEGYDGENIYFIYAPSGGSTTPVDVDPVSGEPQRSGDTGGIRNPRDGLVTIVAWVRGEEGFLDVNSNGIYEPELNEIFYDSGEPFVDVDDDGIFDAGAGDLMIDTDGDGRYTPPNGSWDEETVIWTSFKILWTGPVHQSPSTSRVEIPGGRDIPPGGSREVVAYFVDRNLNPIAANDDGDSLTLTPDCYSCEYPYTTSFALKNTRGFEIDEHGQIEGNIFNSHIFSLSITNTNTYPEPELFTITVTAQTTPAPHTSDGYSPDWISSELTPYSAQILGSSE